MGESGATNEGKGDRRKNDNLVIEMLCFIEISIGLCALQNEQEVPPEDDEQPLVCMICEDKATGLHYGIITCEG